MLDGSCISQKVKSSGNAAEGPYFASETFPNGAPLQRMFNGRPKIQSRGILNGQDGSTNNSYRPWDELCEMYSEKQLSKKEDKLVAVSALAKEFGELFPNGSYAVGMWRSTLPGSLLWTVKAKKRRDPVQEHVILAPS